MPSRSSVYRVAEDRGAMLGVLTPDGVIEPFSCRVPERPVVGDEVFVDEFAGAIVKVNERRTWIARATPNGHAQYVAANVTAGFVVTSPEAREHSPRRAARYLIALRSGGVQPVIVLNKCDSGAYVTDRIDELRSVAGGAPVVPISALDGTNCSALDPYLQPESTVALCGSSGVGKSTLLNRLLCRDAMATDGTRGDGRGRHTTTFRRLFVLPNGAALIDTPGMRAFSAWASGEDVDDTFADVTVLAAGCRLRDCTHSGEPSCAVIDNAAPERLEQWRKLRREAEWLASRDDGALAAERKRRWKNIHKAARQAQRLR